MAADLRHVSFSNGLKMPTVGLGTWKSKPREVEGAVKAALDLGYRHIDCAYLYLNEDEVGTALKEKFAEGVIRREDVFITSKLWNNRHQAADVRPSFMESLTSLGLDYIDLYLIHWPICFKAGGDHFPRDEEGNLQYVDVDHMETWRELEKLVDEGLVKSIGVSNFNSIQIENILSQCRIKPVNLQIEVHPYLSQVELVDYCQSRGVTVTAYSPLGSPDRPWAEPRPPSLLNDSTIISIGEKYGKSAAQVMLRWLVQRGITVIPKSVTPSRIEENAQLYDFELTPDEMNTINGFNKNMRLVTYGNGTTDIVPTAPYFPFPEEYM